MTKPRVTTADRLSNIIEVVELGRRSGLLTVERGSHQSMEQGEVFFLLGRATYAAVEGLRGREALSVLSGWGQCRFAFDPEAHPPAANITAPTAAIRPAPQTSASLPTSAPRSGPPNFGWSAPGIGSQPRQDSQTPGGASWPSGASNSTGQLSWPMPSGSQPLTPPTSPSMGSGPFPSAALERRPRRSPDVRDLMSLAHTHNLSRIQRTLLLLADGEHTVLDLARLSSKPVDEVTALLADLERRGLVY